MLNQLALIRRICLLALVQVVLVGVAGAQEFGEVASDLSFEPRWTGYFKNETAYRVREPRTFTKIRNIIGMRGTLPVTPRMDAVFSGRAYYDLAYDLFDYDTIAARSERNADQPLTFIENLAQQKDSPVAEIRELYVDMYMDNLDLRMGRQFVVWGVLTGVRVVDEINPMDFRELILPDLLDYRIPLWTARADYYGDGYDLEFLFIPDIRFHKPAPPGSEWELLQEVPGTTRPDTFEMTNSEFAVKWEKTFGETDVSLSYFRTWDDFPVIFRRVPVDPEPTDPGSTDTSAGSGGQDGGTSTTVGQGASEGTTTDTQAQFFPRYTRINMFGATFRRLVHGQVLKGELAYVTDKYFALTRIDRNNDGFVDHQGELKRDHIRWGLGLDFNILKTDFSPSLVQWVILDYDPALLQDQVDTTFNLFVRREFAGRRAEFSLLGIYLMNMDEMYLKPKLTVNITDRVQLATGMDIFTGKRTVTGVTAKEGNPTKLNFDVDQRTQFIGNFFDNDRVFVNFKYSF